MLLLFEGNKYNKDTFSCKKVGMWNREMTQAVLADFEPVNIDCMNNFEAKRRAPKISHCEIVERENTFCSSTADILGLPPKDSVDCWKLAPYIAENFIF